MFKIEEVSAHCDIPCGVYDPGEAQYAVLSVIRFIDLIKKSYLSPRLLPKEIYAVFKVRFFLDNFLFSKFAKQINNNLYLL